jgi:hypothetical protein
MRWHFQVSAPFGSDAHCNAVEKCSALPNSRHPAGFRYSTNSEFRSFPALKDMSVPALFFHEANSP